MLGGTVKKILGGTGKFARFMLCFYYFLTQTKKDYNYTSQTRPYNLGSSFPL